MGTHSYTDTCPKCGAEMICWNETRGPYCGGECLECGYTYWIEEAIKSLKELNEIRKEFDLKPLKKLRCKMIGCKDCSRQISKEEYAGNDGKCDRCAVGDYYA